METEEERRLLSIQTSTTGPAVTAATFLAHRQHYKKTKRNLERVMPSQPKPEPHPLALAHSCNGISFQ